jgi:hypothetical protein
MYKWFDAVHRQYDREIVMYKGLGVRTNFNINDVLASLDPQDAKRVLDEYYKKRGNERRPTNVPDFLPEGACPQYCQ